MLRDLESRPSPAHFLHHFFARECMPCAPGTWLTELRPPGQAGLGKDLDNPHLRGAIRVWEHVKDPQQNISKLFYHTFQQLEHSCKSWCVLKNESELNLIDSFNKGNFNTAPSRYADIYLYAWCYLNKNRGNMPTCICRATAPIAVVAGHPLWYYSSFCVNQYFFPQNNLFKRHQDKPDRLK